MESNKSGKQALVYLVSQFSSDSLDHSFLSGKLGEIRETLKAGLKASK